MWSNMVNMMNGQGCSGMGLGMIGMALFWILAIAIIVTFVVLLAKGASSRNRQEKSALDILKERYASGEIERDEYEQKKRDLGG